MFKELPSEVLRMIIYKLVLMDPLYLYQLPLFIIKSAAFTKEEFILLINESIEINYKKSDICILSLLFSNNIEMNIALRNFVMYVDFFKIELCRESIFDDIIKIGKIINPINIDDYKYLFTIYSMANDFFPLEKLFLKFINIHNENVSKHCVACIENSLSRFDEKFHSSLIESIIICENSIFLKIYIDLYSGTNLEKIITNKHLFVKDFECFKLLFNLKFNHEKDIKVKKRLLEDLLLSSISDTRIFDFLIEHIDLNEYKSDFWKILKFSIFYKNSEIFERFYSKKVVMKESYEEIFTCYNFSLNDENLIKILKIIDADFNIFSKGTFFEMRVFETHDLELLKSLKNIKKLPIENLCKVLSYLLRKEESIHVLQWFIETFEEKITHRSCYIEAILNENYLALKYIKSKNFKWNSGYYKFIKSIKMLEFIIENFPPLFTFNIFDNTRTNKSNIDYFEFTKILVKANRYFFLDESFCEYACLERDLEFLKWLISKNADINVKKCLKFFDDIKHCDGIYHTIWLEENFKGSKNKEIINLLKNLKY
jgi:hypothetical protein